MARKVFMSADQYYTKWSSRLSASQQQITDGVNSVKDSPMAAAAASKQKMRNNILEAIDSGKWEAALKAVPLDYWRNQMINVGIPRISTGAQNAQAKVTAFANELLSFIGTTQSKVNSMPDATFTDRINKMVSWATEMHKFRKKPFNYSG